MGTMRQRQMPEPLLLMMLLLLLLLFRHYVDDANVSRHLLAHHHSMLLDPLLRLNSSTLTNTMGTENWLRYLCQHF